MPVCLKDSSVPPAGNRENGHSNKTRPIRNTFATRKTAL
uniref:Uncharacterized protein n=1 Tax=Anguilla anguilla TaxID=7936 RepID=A0A0E9VP32_ANGAN